LCFINFLQAIWLQTAVLKPHGAEDGFFKASWGVNMDIREALKQLLNAIARGFREINENS
jgi:hypothetical protein